MENLYLDFEENGYAVIESFLDEKEIDSLKEECRNLVDKMNPDEHTVFSTVNEIGRDDYFLNSGDKIRYFIEEEAYDEDKKLNRDKFLAINKIGHALHLLSPPFKAVTFSDKIKNVAKELQLKDPVIPQSMYIFKQPFIGGMVTPHQDGTFLYTTPMKIVGFWIALEDTTIENGCLWFVRGSHKSGLYGDYRMVRNKNYAKDESKCVVFQGDKVSYTDRDWIPVPVKKGALVLIDGLVLHKSEKNMSNKSRHIYTFHLFEGSCEWSKENWLQPTDNMPFPHLFKN